MAKNSVSEWSTTAASNTDVGGNNIAEGCPPSSINNAIRTVMAQLKTYFGTLKNVAFSGSAGDLSTGILSNDRLSGDYSLRTMTVGDGLVSGSTTQPRLSFGEQSGFYRTINSIRCSYAGANMLDISAGGVATTGTLTASLGMQVNGNTVFHAGNQVTLGGSSASARSALGLGGLATMDIGDLVYNGTSTSNTTFPVGSYVAATRSSNYNRNASVSVWTGSGGTTFYSLGSGDSQLGGTWRFHGSTSSSDALMRRTA